MIVFGYLFCVHGLGNGLLAMTAFRQRSMFCNLFFKVNKWGSFFKD